MGQVQSIDPKHLGIYKKLLGIQNLATRLQMIDTLLGDPAIVHSAKITGVYGQLLQVSGAIRHGHVPPILPGESISTQTKLAPQKSNNHLPSNLQHHPQALQMPVQQTNQMVPHMTSRSNDPYQHVSKPKRSEKALNFFSACLRVLNIQEEVTLTEDSLKLAYKKAVIRAHPDKQGGSKDAFDAVTRAYAYLIDILKLVQGRQTKNGESVQGLDSIQEQRKSATSEWEMPNEPVKLNPKNLNMTVFNQLFEQNRIPDPDEDGYGNWLKDETDGNTSKRKSHKKFSEDFNRDVFNRIFEEEQGENTGQLTRFQQPQELMMSSIQAVELGRGRPADYTAAPNSDLQFTDLRSAYTKENTVSNQVKGVRIENRDFHSYKAQRERAPDVYNQSELDSLAAYESQQKAREEVRRIRAAQEQITARDYFERMKQLVITEK